jgi:hypothetical protein
MKTSSLAILMCAFLTPSFALSCPAAQTGQDEQHHLSSELHAAPNDV